MDPAGVHKKFSRNNTGFLIQGSSQLAAGWGGCLLPTIQHFPAGAAGSEGTQQASMASGQQSIQESNWRSGKKRNLAASKSREPLEGSHSYEKCLVSDFSPRSRMKYTYVCTYIYVLAKKSQIHVSASMYTYFKMAFFVRNPVDHNEFLLFSATKFLRRQLKAKIRQDNFRDPS